MHKFIERALVANVAGFTILNCMWCVHMAHTKHCVLMIGPDCQCVRYLESEYCARQVKRIEEDSS